MSVSARQTNISTVRGVTVALLAAVAFTSFWLGINLIFPGLQATGIPSTVVRLIIHVLLLVGLWIGLGRTDFDNETRVRVWLVIAITFTAWLAVVWWLAVAGAFRPNPNQVVPALPIAIFAPVFVAMPLLLRSKRVAAILDTTPASWLIGIQAYRIFGGMFLIAWIRGELSGTFALPAGIGDIFIGLLALPVAYLLYAGTRGSRRVAIVWNVLGIVDLTIAVGIGMLSAPGPLQLIIPDVPNAQLGTFPAVMIPAFAVPSSILLHGLSLRQLRRMGRKSTATSAPDAAASLIGAR